MCIRDRSTEADRGEAKNYAFYLGTSNAPTNGGYSISLSYKKINLSLGGSYSLGGKILNNITCPVSYTMLNESSAAVESIPTQENDLYTNFLNVTKDRVNRWTKDNPITNGYPRIIDAYGEYLGLDNYMITSSQITRASMLEKVSYFKLGSLLLGYNFENEWLKRAHISSLALSFSVSNLFIITDVYKRQDPAWGNAYQTLFVDMFKSGKKSLWKDVHKQHRNTFALMQKRLYGIEHDADKRLLMGDDLKNPSDRFYGNSLLQAKGCDHGTFVAGVIAGQGINNAAITGVWPQARLMIIRAVPDGDEYDKDISTAIRYAVDNLSLIHI